MLEKFALTVEKERPINSFFNLSGTLLAFHADNEHSLDFGCSDEKAFYVNSSNGKKKVTFDDFAGFIAVTKPDKFVLPYEFIDETCGEKRQSRAFKKTFEFLNSIDFPESQPLWPIFPKIQSCYENLFNLKENAKIKGFIVFGALDSIDEQIKELLTGREVILAGNGTFDDFKMIKKSVFTGFILRFHIKKRRFQASRKGIVHQQI